MSETKPKIWDCKIGEAHPALVPPGANEPMRRAVERAYFEITGQQPAFIFSGWGAELTEGERAVVENRVPSEEHHREWCLQQAAPALLEALETLLAAMNGTECIVDAIDGAHAAVKAAKGER